MQSLVDVMSNVSAGEKHLTYHIANGLTKMLDRFRNRRSGQIGVGVRTRHAPITDRAKVLPQQQDLIVEPFDIHGLDLDAWNDFGSTFDFFQPSGS